MQSRELGLHQLRSGDLVAFVSLGPANPRELTDVFSDTEALRPIAEATGGSVRRVAAGGGDIVMPRIQAMRSGSRFAGGDWIGIGPSESAIVRGVSVFPLAIGLIGLALLIGATLVAWVGGGTSARVKPSPAPGRRRSRREREASERRGASLSPSLRSHTSLSGRGFHAASAGEHGALRLGQRALRQLRRQEPLRVDRPGQR